MQVSTQVRPRTPEEFLFNLFTSISCCARLAHACLRTFPSDKITLRAMTRNYIINLASCLETYYRDLFVYAAEREESVLEQTFESLKTLRSVKLKPATLLQMQREGVDLVGYVSDHLRLQSIQEINSVMSAVFHPNNYCNTLDSTKHVFIVLSKSPEPALISLSSDWRRHLSDLFDLRHDLVHDANRQCRVPGKLMARYENLVMFVSQLTAMLAIECFGGKTLTTDRGPAFLVIGDLISDDWELADKEQSGMWLSQTPD